MKQNVVVKKVETKYHCVSFTDGSSIDIDFFPTPPKAGQTWELETFNFNEVKGVKLVKGVEQ